MANFKRHIALLGLLVFLLPTTVQLLHTFENHKHIVCTSKIEHHAHKQEDTNCKICEFTLSSFIISEFLSLSEIEVVITNVYPNFYHFLSSYKKLHFLLRAPPLVCI